MKDQHVGRRMAECLLLQHDGRPCALCPACAIVRDALRSNKSATFILDTMHARRRAAERPR